MDNPSKHDFRVEKKAEKLAGATPSMGTGTAGTMQTFVIVPRGGFRLSGPPICERSCYFRAGLLDRAL